ncbi:MAG TPA: M12 family metallo-peptidase [Candidatus Polarisedimenticolia bacterium]|nr:M12 family metallo-peptidase [Candidatus Polarisedimenticolia bacterium]
MGRFAALVLPVVVLFALLFCLAATPVLADHIDGMTLKLSHGSPPGSVSLDWTGGQPLFRVYRSTSKSLIVDPANLIGTVDVRTFADAPASGSVFFYEIASACAYNPPEVCNGVDDDCDGTIDGPGSEASCSLPNAVAVCALGSCAVASCTGGWGDCDGVASDGCEAPLGAAQSNSPATIWANDPNPNKDLAPGYLRVPRIRNCGACGMTCDDGIACTTDLCVPQAGSAVVAACRHYDRGQCSEARCGGLPLPPGTPPPGDAACTAVDSDGDGLNDPWEVPQSNPYDGSVQLAGIDLDCDGKISDTDGDYVYSDPPSPSVKDIYVKFASMAQGPSDGDSHAPQPGVLDEVVAAFGRHGIVLHADPLISEVPHFGTVSFGGTGAACGGADSTTVDDLKQPVFDPRAKFTHHFIIFGHDSCSDSKGSGTSGLAEIKGNDAVVSLGGFTYTGTPTEVHENKTHEQAGTLMHELGHNLGLDHDGAAPCTPSPCAPSLKRKPNYISSMNHLYQLNGIPRAATPGSVSPPDPDVPWRVDFSPAALGTLDEANLNEIGGLSTTTPPYDRDVVRYYCHGQGPFFAPGRGPIDWNCDGVFSPNVASDIDLDQTFSALTGSDDWDNLRFAFQCTATFTNATIDPSLVTPRGPTDPALVTPDELTFLEAETLGLRAIPPPCLTDSDCDDGVFCNGAEICQPALGLCQPGTPRTCDDGNPCTSDACSAATDACVNSFVPNGAACDDGLFCTVGETCTGGVCGGATPRSCEDGVACTANACSEALRACVVTCTTAPCFSTALGPGVSAGGPRSDRSILPAGLQPTNFVVKGKSLHALRTVGDASGPAGSIKWTWNDPPGLTVNNFPSPVPLSTSGSEYIFLGGTDGFLYKIRASDGVQTLQADTRRPTCSSDQIYATPAVQLYNFSNTAWRTEMDSHAGHVHDDVVYVITRTMCADSTHNRVIAFYASTLEIKAIFNFDGAYNVDFGADACALDYANNALYCGTNQNATAPTQTSLWALNTITLVPLWGDNAGSILNRPMLAGGRIYVAYRSGSVQAYDPAGNGTGGALRLWTAPPSVPAGVLRSPWAEFRPPSGQNSIFVLDGGGTLHRFTDHGSSATHDWSVSPGTGVQFVTMPVFAPGLERLYLGRSDGKLQQVDAASGAAGTAVPVTPPGLVFDAGIDLPAGSPYGWLTVPSGDTPGGVTGFCAPLP